MKVPYLNKKIKEEFRDYLDELKVAVAASTDRASMDLSTSDEKQSALFRQIYPLFVLLRKLEDSVYFEDPSRNIVLSEMQKDGNKIGFLKALAFTSTPPELVEKLKRGASARIFSGYFNELFSDTLMLCNSYYTFNYRGAMISLRCMLEDLYRHIYYKDHLQEFLHINSETATGNREASIGLSASAFRTYLKRASYLSEFVGADENFLPRTSNKANVTDTEENFVSLFDANEQLYGECSSFVHASGRVAMSQFKSNLDLSYNEQYSDLVCNKTKRFIDMAIAFLIAAHFDHFISFSEYDRSIILSGYNLEKRKNFRRLINV